jgi:hypothetical protein
MKPVNQPARKAAITRFLILYGVSLLAIVVCAWIILSIPNDLLHKTIEGYKSTEQEQTKLTSKIEGMITNLKSIITADQAYINTSNEIEKGGLMTNLQEYQKKINDALVEVKNDTATLISPISKKNANSSIVAFNAILSFRNTLTALQKSLQERGGDAEQLIKLQSELDKCNSQLDIYREMAAAKPPPPAP